MSCRTLGNGGKFRGTLNLGFVFTDLNLQDSICLATLCAHDSGMDLQQLLPSVMKDPQKTRVMDLAPGSEAFSPILW